METVNTHHMTLARKLIDTQIDLMISIESLAIKTENDKTQSNLLLLHHEVMRQMEKISCLAMSALKLLDDATNGK